MWWGALETIKQYFHLKDKQKEYQGKQCITESYTTSSSIPLCSASGSFPFGGTLFPHQMRPEAPVRLKMYLFLHAESHPKSTLDGTAHAI